VAEHDDLVRRLVESLADDPAFVLHGELVTDPWGAGQWVAYTDPDGRVHYLRIVVEPYRQT
jgi:hypothetical protein